MREGFDGFVAARTPALWRTAWLLTGDRHQAEDLVQTALMKAWPRYSRIEREGGSFEAYVRRALFNTHISWWRRRRFRETALDRVEHYGEVADNTDSALRVTMLAALSRLSDRQRSVIVLRFFEDMSEEETAKTLNCSVGSVKTHQHRALQALRDSPVLRSHGLSELL